MPKNYCKPFVTRFHVTYPILATGVTVNDSLRTEKTLPEIQEIVAFPTTIFIDKKGMIQKIHTGFNGPGTGEHYEIYKTEFNKLVNNLLHECVQIVKRNTSHGRALAINNHLRTK